MCCVCDIDDGPEFCKETFQRARKRHICCECGSDIDPGEKYFKISGVWDGHFSTYKQCLVCKAVMDEAYRQGYDCICFEYLWETVGTEFEYAAV